MHHPLVTPIALQYAPSPDIALPNLGAGKRTWTHHKSLNCYAGRGAIDGQGVTKLNVENHQDCMDMCRQRSACSAVVLGIDKKLQRKGIKYVCWLHAKVKVNKCASSRRYDTYVWRYPSPPPPPPFIAIHDASLPTPAAWIGDETHDCRNLSGLWQPAAPGLAQRYESTALIEGEVYDSRMDAVVSLSRKSKPWTWQHNNSRPPTLLVFREQPLEKPYETHQPSHQPEKKQPRDGFSTNQSLLPSITNSWYGLFHRTPAEKQQYESAAPSTLTTPLPAADEMDWTAALRGRVVVFIGDSLGSYQAINLLLLASNRRLHSIESVKRSFFSTSGESMHQSSWCRAVCSKVRGPWSRMNRCREVHLIVCWLSAGKSESPSMLRRTLALVATWLFSYATTLERRDIVVANVGHHFLPHHGRTNVPGYGPQGHARQLAPFVEACKWHAKGLWRLELSPNDEAAAKAYAVEATAAKAKAVAASVGLEQASYGGSSALGPGGWRQRVPHTLYRETSPQFWAGGIFPGRAGTSSKKHACLPEWDYEPVQQAERRRQPQARRGLGEAASNSTLDVLLGATAFDAYNARQCELLAKSPVGLLKVWLPSALLGSREASTPRDCTHSYLYGSTNAMWNQLMMHAVWRREASISRETARPKYVGSAREEQRRWNRLATWEQLRAMLIYANENVKTRDKARDGSYVALCEKWIHARGGPNGTSSAYRPAPATCNVSY